MSSLHRIKFWLLLLALGLCLPSPAAVAPAQLRCEFQDRPLAIQTAQPRLSWLLPDDRPGARQTAYRLLAATRPELLAEGQADLWDTQKITSDQSLNIKYAGKPLSSAQRVYWTVKIWDDSGAPSPYAPPAHWQMGILKPGDWQAKLIRMRQEAPFANDAVEAWLQYGVGNKATPAARDFVTQRMKPAPYFRREFSLAAVPAKATLYLASLGYCELRINGRLVGDRGLNPAYQEYDKQIYYCAYDVAPYLKPGPNAIALLVGNGWYCQEGQFFGKPLAEFYTYKQDLGSPGVIVQLEADGQIGLASDAQWKTSYGPLLRNQLFIGEVYDARREMPGWDLPGFNDAAWQPVEAVPAPAARLAPMQIPPDRPVREVPAKQILEPAPGIYVVDLGETICGWPKITVAEPAGTQIALRPSPYIRNAPQFMTGHRLPYPDPKLDGKFLTNMIGGELASRIPDADGKARTFFANGDLFVTRGQGRETFERRFSYVGFRFFEICGLTKKPSLQDVSGVVVHTDLPATGKFACSDAKVNELYDSFSRTLRYCTHGLVNDNSDAEKNSFRGHQAMAGDFLAYAWNHPQFWAKAVDDIRLQTARTGPHAGLPPIKAPAPNYFYAGAGGPLNALADTVFEATRALLFSGDTDLAQRHFDDMLRFVNLYAERLADPRSLDLFDRKNDKASVIMQGDWLDVWKNGERPQMGAGASSRGDIVYRCLFVIALDQLIASAQVLGKAREHSALAALRERLAKTINQLAYDASKKSYGSQAENLLALRAGIVPPADIPAVAADLKRLIMVDWQGHLSVGFVGVRYLSSVLGDFGYPEIAHHLWTVNTWPSWRWLYENGYDTANSYWNDFHKPGVLPAARFIQSEKPVAAVYCYESLAGIKPVFAQPGFKHFLVAPKPPPAMAWASAEVQTPYGAILSSWKHEGQATAYTIKVPANTTATLRLPIKETTSAFPAFAAGLKLLGPQPDPGGRVVVLEAQPGRYTFRLE